jgi:hypothetical protein
MATTQETHETFAMPFLMLAERNRLVLEKMTRVTQEETLHFLNQNLERNLRTLERLRECRGISGVMEVETEWLTGMVRDSIEQTQRVAKVWWRLAEEESENQTEAASQGVSAPARAERKPERHQGSEEKRAAA